MERAGEIPRDGIREILGHGGSALWPSRGDEEHMSAAPAGRVMLRYARIEARVAGPEFAVPGAGVSGGRFSTSTRSSGTDLGYVRRTARVGLFSSPPADL